MKLYVHGGVSGENTLEPAPVLYLAKITTGETR